MNSSRTPWLRSRVVVFGWVVCLLQAGTLGAQTAPAEIRAFKSGDRDQARHNHAAANECPVDVDFEFRDILPQTDTPEGKWNTKWGPSAKTYPAFAVPDCVKEPVAYQRQRVIAVAREYLGLPYRHKHIPAAGGLDCSNFTSWVYNYGFGIRFSSHVEKQAETAGRRLDPDEAFEPGDLLFQTDKRKEHIAHAVIYLGDDKIIDSTKGKVAIRKFGGWYKDRHSHARRIIE